MLLEALYQESNYVIKYKRELSRRSPKKQLHISKSRRKGKAVEDYAESSYRIRAMALTVDT